MAIARMRKIAVRFTVAAALAAALAGGAYALFAPPPLEKSGHSYRLATGSLLYTFDAAFRHEALFDRSRDPHEEFDVSSRRPDDLRRLRDEFLRQLRASSLEQVPVECEAEVAALRSLGYF